MFRMPVSGGLWSRPVRQRKVRCCSLRSPAVTSVSPALDNQGLGIRNNGRLLDWYRN